MTLPRYPRTAPPTARARAEVLCALDELVEQSQADWLQRRRSECAALRSELADIRRSLVEIQRECLREVRADLRRYSPDQPRVPAGNSAGGQWTKEDESRPSGDSSLSIIPDSSSPVGATQSSPLYFQISDDSIKLPQKMSGDVINICILERFQPWPGSCLYWCPNGGYLLTRQRNLGLACPSIIVEPGL